MSQPFSLHLAHPTRHEHIVVHPVEELLRVKIDVPSLASRNVRACISLDGELPPISAFPEFPDKKRFQQPVLLLEVDHTGERMPFSPEQYNDFLRKKEAELSLCPPDSYDVLLKSAGLFHGGFSDYRLLAANGRPQEANEAIRNLSVIESYMRAFLDKTLKQEKEPLLDTPLQSTEAKVKKYGQ